MSAADEQTIETELTALVTRIDRAMGRSTKVGCLTWLVGLPAGVVMIRNAWNLGLFATAVLVPVLALGGLLAFGVLAAQYDDWVAGRMARRFQRRFPVGSPERDVALRVLSELRSTGKGLEKLRVRLRRLEPAVTRVRSVAPEAAVRGALEQPQPPETIQDSGPRVIPLEPFEPDDGKKP